MENLNLVNAIDPRLEALAGPQRKLKWHVPQGAAYTNKVAQKANSVSNQSVSFNFNTQGKNVLIDRRFYTRMRFRCTFNCANTTGNADVAVQTGQDAIRAFPIASCAENVSVSINGTSVSCNYADMFQAYQHFSSPVELSAYELSGTPTQLDFYQQYDQIPDPSTNTKSPFSASGYASGQQLPRAAFNLIHLTNPAIANGASGVAVAEFEVVEPLMISPLLYSSTALESALLGVTNLAVNINFGDLSRVWSQGTRAGIATTCTTTILGTPELLMEYKNLQLVGESKIPEVVRYNYQRPEVYVNDINQTIAAATTISFPTLSVTNNAIQLSACPKKIYIYASKARGTKTFKDADTFVPITSLSLSYLNVSGQFSAFSQADLYNMCVKNGYAGSFQEWSGKALAGIGGAGNITSAGYTGRDTLTGGVLCIDSTDLALPSNIASGCLVNSQLQFQLGLENVNRSAVDVVITTIVVQDGVMEISEGGMTTRIGVITSDEILAVRSSGVQEPMTHGTQLQGGGIFDVLKDIVDKVPEAIEHGKTVYETGMKIKDLAGLGRTQGGAFVGGKAMSKADLKRLLAQ